jgi:hypothetical protein
MYGLGRAAWSDHLGGVAVFVLVARYSTLASTGAGMRTTETYIITLLRSLASESVVVLILAGTASEGVIYTGVDATFSDGGAVAWSP